MKDKLKYYLFYFYASQCWFYIKPKKCYVIDKDNCKIWNCRYHYVDNKFESGCHKDKAP